jgi:hypothetical protein
MKVKRGKAGRGFTGEYSTVKHFTATAKAVMLVPASLTTLILCAALSVSAVNAPLALAGGGDANEAVCSNEGSPGFRAYLPDCRAYEMVTPPFKDGAVVTASFISSDGSAVIDGNVFGGFAGTLDNPALGAAYEYARTGSGWATSPLDPPASQFVAVGDFSGIEDESENFEKALLTLRTASQPSDAVGFYVRGPEGSFSEVGPAVSPATTIEPPSLYNRVSTNVEYRGASDDLSHILFNISSPSAEGHSYLWPFDATREGGFPSLYEYSGTGNAEPTLVGVAGGRGSRALVSQCGTQLGSFPGGERYNAVSADGSKVFFTARGAESEECGEGYPNSQPKVNELFARVNRSQTVAISEPSEADCTACKTGNGQARAVFVGASRDGSKVFFITEQELLSGQTTNNLYEYDFNGLAGEKVTLVSRGSPTPEVQGVARVSEDGSHVFFVADGVLAGEPDRSLPVGHQVPVSGEPNLYVFDTETQELAFIATLSVADESDWQVEDERPVEATPDGGFLLFASHADPLLEGTKDVTQLFRYEARTGVLVRISIGQNGFNNDGITGPLKRLTSEGQSGIEENVSFPDPEYFRSHATPPIPSISEDGSYVFFQGAVGLTPGAVNEQRLISPSGEVSYAQNVYEFHDGAVYLISDGQDRSLTRSAGGSSVRLQGTDATGDDVFFTTTDPLVPQDTDTGIDIYDARVQGGFPAPATPGECEGDGCQAMLSPQPPLASPGSQTQVGGGNVSSPPKNAAPKSKATSLTRAQKLANALKACRKQPKRKRATCVKQAKKEFGRKSTTKQADRGGK